MQVPEAADYEFALVQPRKMLISAGKSLSSTHAGLSKNYVCCRLYMLKVV